MQKLFPWLKVAAWAGIIFLLSSIPDLKSGLDEDFILRKIAHITEYWILTYLLLRAFNVTFAVSPKTIVLVSILTAVIYAMTDEFHQQFVPGRHGCLQDVFIDSIGIISCAIFFRKR